MKKQHSGAIVNVSSLAARAPSAGRSTLYGPLKSAINNLTNTFAGEYCPYNVRVTCIMPGFTVTPLVRAHISQEELDRNANAYPAPPNGRAGGDCQTNRIPGK